MDADLFNQLMLGWQNDLVWIFGSSALVAILARIRP
jgi:hypothetical protein